MTKTKRTQKALARTLFATLFIVLFSTPQAIGSEEFIRLISRKGAIFTVVDKEPQALEDNRKLPWTRMLKVGDIEDSGQLVEEPEKLREAFLVLEYSERELITLANGSTIARIQEDEEDHPEFTINGAAHLFIKPNEEAGDFTFILNDFQFRTTAAHLFYSDLRGKPGITVLEGTVSTLIPEGFPDRALMDTTSAAIGDTTKDATADSTGDRDADLPEPQPTELSLESGSRLDMYKDSYEIVSDVQTGKESILDRSLVPGFEVNGSYVPAGIVEFDGESLEILRYEKSSLITDSPAPLMTGDEIKTSEAQTATLRLAGKDDIRLSGESSFTIEDYNLEPEKPSILFSFIGKIRAKVFKRKTPSNIRFRTITAVIGVKGTDFEAIADESSSEVATVEGTVGVSDPSGKGEVLVEAGMMTSVAAGALPAAPQPIPPERMQQLYDERMPIAAEDIIELKNITFLEPQDQASYSKPKISLELEPEDADIEFLLDEKHLLTRNGAVLPELAEGQHTLTVKGIGEDAYSKSVSFVTDTTPPTLSPQDQLEGTELKQGFPPEVTWSEPLEKLELKAGQTTIPASGNEQATQFRLDTTSLYQNAQNGQKITLAFSAIDKAGNQTTTEKTITLKLKPMTPPIVRIGEGLPTLTTGSVKPIKVTADREAESWQVLLNNQPITLPTTAAEQEPVEKNSLVLPESLFTDLQEGKHTLVVSAIDDFELMGSQKLDIVIDKTTPTLSGPVELIHPLTVKNETRDLDFQNLYIKEGESIRLKWSEDVSNVVFELGQQKLPLAKSQDGEGFVIQAADIKRMMGSMETAGVRIYAEDAAGNRASIPGTFFFKTRPDNPPQITIGEGQPSIGVNTVKDIEVKADREIFQWQVFLDGEELQLMSEEEQKAAMPVRSIHLKSDLFASLDDGSHKLSVFGSDAFSLKGSSELSIDLDSQTPRVIYITNKLKPDDLKLDIDATLEIEWSEALSVAAGSLRGKPWDIKLSSDKKRLFIHGDKSRLSYADTPYKIMAIDKVGNITELNGVISLKKPRNQALWENYQNTVLQSTEEPIDKMMLTTRPEFQLNTAKPETSPKQQEEKPRLQKRNLNNSEFIIQLNEPFINSMTGF